MAGCQWTKFKGATECKAVLRHNDKEERKKVKHANEHLDTSKTDLNYDLFREFNPESNYKLKCDMYDKKIKALEENAIRLKKDRVTMVGIEIPIPNEIPDDKVRDFVQDTYCAVAETVGSPSHIIAVDEHSDEVHSYVDAKTKADRQSMRHIHISCVPGIEDKDEQGNTIYRLNAKNFCTRSRMIHLNNELQKICETKYDCKFMTGEKTKSTDNVESLKLKSKKAENDIQEARITKLTNKLVKMIKEDRVQIDADKKKIKEDRAEIERDRAQNAKDKADNEKEKERLERWEESLNNREELKSVLQTANGQFAELYSWYQKNKAEIEQKDPNVIKNADAVKEALKRAENLNDKLIEYQEAQY